MTAIANPCVVSYGAHPFSVMSKITGIECRNVLDSAGRTVTHKVCTIRVRDYVQNDTGCDPDFLALRRSLEVPADTLVISNVGFGSFSLNGVIEDLKWGPIPKILSWENKGGGNAAEFTWQVECAVLEDIANADGRIMEFCWDLSFDVDDSGYQTRTYSGHFTIAQTRKTQGTRTLAAVADEEREKIYPPLMNGFYRKPGQFKLSEDKCTETFTITDIEGGKYFPPPGCVHAKASHTVRSEQMNLRSWSGTISAEYELRKDLPRSLATQFFIQLVASRLSPSARAIKASGTGRAAQAVIPTNVEMGEPDIYGRDVLNFSLQYSYVTDLDSLLAASGLWVPVPNSSWSNWSKSMQKTLSSRGNAKLAMDPNEDLIVDLRTNDLRIPKGNPGIAVVGVNQATISQLLGAMSFDAANITAKNSWIDFSNKTNVKIVDEVAELKACAAAKIEQATGIKGKIVTGVLQTIIDTVTPLKVASIGYKALNQAKTIAQTRVKPSTFVSLIGYALRALYPINYPQLVLAGGSTPIAWNTHENFFLTGVVANWGVPIYGARWNIRYFVPSHEDDLEFTVQGNCLMDDKPTRNISGRFLPRTS